MQAHQAAPCPYCGATWNPPGAQYCANCRNQLPVAVPTFSPPVTPPQASGWLAFASGRGLWYWVGGAVLLLLVLLLGVIPAVASGQINNAEQALAGALSHQSQVDAAFDDFLRTDATSPDVAALKAQVEKELQSVRNGLATVQVDRSRLSALARKFGDIFTRPPGPPMSESSRAGGAAG